MDTRSTLIAAALEVLEHDGEAQFSTRAVCAMAGVTAPTLYHHFGSADGLLSAAVEEAFGQFLASKKSEALSADPELALRQGWDNYVRFSAQRPRL
jgi:AcrR family transcriptional regulator